MFDFPSEGAMALEFLLLGEGGVEFFFLLLTVLA